MSSPARHRRVARRCALSLLLIGLASVAHAGLSSATTRAWQPALMLTGEGDATRAVTAMRGAADLWGVALNHTDFDPVTRDFTTRAMQSFRNFDLKGMYELLPEQNGPFRELKVRGERKQNRYVVGRPEDSRFEVAPGGSREQPGDSSMVIRSRGVPAPDGDTNYLIQARGGIVVGKIGWPMVLASNRQWFELVASTQNTEPSARPMVAVRETTKQANPRLGHEDVEIVATLWEAFPRMSYLVSSLGRINDVIANRDAQTNVTHVRLELQMDVDRAAERYPDLAQYLEKLGKLFKIHIDWVDAKGRTIASFDVESEHLRTRIELHVKDGFILPVHKGHVFVDEPIDPRRGPLRYSTRVRTDFRMMGMYSHMRGGRMDWHYRPTERGMEVQARMTHVPTVTVDGAALGFIPSSWVDAFIPGDLHSLITEFLTTACTGNEGRGVAFTARFDQRPSGAATFDIKFGFEALNNFLVKLGVGFFNDRVMPDEDVRADIKRLMSDAQGSFSADVERFARAN